MVNSLWFVVAWDVVNDILAIFHFENVVILPKWDFGEVLYSTEKLDVH